MKYFAQAESLDLQGVPLFLFPLFGAEGYFPECLPERSPEENKASCGLWKLTRKERFRESKYNKKILKGYEHQTFEDCKLQPSTDGSGGT